MSPEIVEKKMGEGRTHLNYCIKMYTKQIKKGKIFLHEHPGSATSWQEEGMQELMKIPGVILVQANMCRFGMTSVNDEGEEQLKGARRSQPGRQDIQNILYFKVSQLRNGDLQAGVSLS